jgi:hypothetical protein
VSEKLKWSRHDAGKLVERRRSADNQDGMALLANSLRPVQGETRMRADYGFGFVIA